MKRGHWIAILVGAAVVIAAVVGWRGSRPRSPDAHPATGTLTRDEAGG